MATWKIDPAHTDIAFSAKHMMVTTVRGKFDTVAGELVLDEDQPERSTGEIRIDAASLSTGVEQRDAHLRSADFFDAEHHPLIVVRATGVQPKGDHYLVKADATIRGVTRPVSLEAEYLGTVASLKGGRHAGFHLWGSINREDWGLTWNMGLEAGGWLVSKEIKLDIDVAAELAAETGEDRAGAAA